MKVTKLAYSPIQSWVINVALVLHCILSFHTDYTTVAQKTTSVAFTGNGRLQGPTRARITTESQWILESLDAHNYFRSLHGSPPLRLNQTLSEISQYYANSLLARNHENIASIERGVWKKIYFEHNSELGGVNIGENLYYSISTTLIEPVPSPHAVILWYEEIKDYDFSTAERKPTSKPTSQIGHLTQLLWSSTSDMGTAYASRKLRNNQTVIFVVANYFKQGNVNLIWDGNKKKLFWENVLPPNRSEADINAIIVSKHFQSWWKEPEPKMSTSGSWRNIALDTHNSFRISHGAQPLRINKDLCKVSQSWANHLLESGLQRFNYIRRGHDYWVEPNSKASICELGEISKYFITVEDKLSAEDAVNALYNHISPQDSTRKPNTFEQIIWNSTTEFCISYARRKTNSGQYLTFVSANYYPSATGDLKDRQQNVFKKKESSSIGAGIVFNYIMCSVFHFPFCIWFYVCTIQI